MKKPYTHSTHFLKPLGLVSLLLTILLFACGPSKVLNRAFEPELRSDVAVTTSEIREVAFQQLRSEKGHQDLHLSGQLFVKQGVGNKARIKPCSGCSIRLTTTADTSLSANLTTLKDGYFEFNGKVLPYTLTVSNKGLNPLVLENIELEREGMTILRIINAAGNTSERFRLTKTGRVYSWDKLL
jgi:hypothetical protein